MSVFSQRLPWDRPENALARAERARREAGLPLIDLSESNPTRVGLTYPETELREALGAVAADGYEPSPLGLRAAREAVADDYRSQGLAVEADGIVTTASSSESYSLLFKLLCDPGDTILVPEPSYPLFDYLARLEGVRSIGYRLSYDGEWHVDFDSLAAARAQAASAGSPVRALVTVNPNNPTGSLTGWAELERLADICGAAQLVVISDEVFAPYRFEAERRHVLGEIVGGDAAARRAAPACLAATPALTERVLTFSLGGLSKSCGLPQLKLGWICAAGPAPLVGAALARLELIADTYLSVGGPVQRALPRLLQLGGVIRSGIQDRVRRNRAALRAALAPQSPCSLLAAAGGWAAILRVPDVATGAGPSDEEWALRLLTRHGVLIHPGYLFDMPAGAYLVASLLPAPDTFARGAAAVIACCSDSVP